MLSGQFAPNHHGKGEDARKAPAFVVGTMAGMVGSRIDVSDD